MIRFPAPAAHTRPRRFVRLAGVVIVLSGLVTSAAGAATPTPPRTPERVPLPTQPPVTASPAAPTPTSTTVVPGGALPSTTTTVVVQPLPPNSPICRNKLSALAQLELQKARVLRDLVKAEARLRQAKRAGRPVVANSFEDRTEELVERVNMLDAEINLLKQRCP